MNGAGDIRSVLIANRGEIAVRVARACRELGVRAIAVHSEADRGARHTRVADLSVEIGPGPASESYLRGDVLVAAAKEAGADAIHPGYGFLSQNADFADEVEAAGLRFVGPSGDAMRLMGDKTAARRAMAEAGVPVVPGFEGDGSEDLRTLRAEAVRIGFPLLVKAAAGGGGRGMRIVREEAELEDALASAGREAEKAFGNGRLFLERFLESARHVEIQVLADRHGRCLHLRERECSVQRRYQKIVEEGPSPLLDDALRDAMGRAAVRAAEACGYVGAGTVEFLVVPGGEFFFLEMNTRVQVEHPVTELVVGIDIVGWQLRIAGGEALPYAQDDVRGLGHAIECRINAEDPAHDFAPSTGRILLAAYPEGPGIRVDTGFESGDEVPIHYDSLVAKLLVHAEDRPAAIRRMRSALDRTSILGISTNVEYLKAILDHEVFRRGEATTTFIADHMAAPPADAEAETPDEALIAAALFEFATPRSGRADDSAPREGDVHSPWDVTDGWRAGG